MRKEKIPFIYNYCDRWCERCAYTSRCAVFLSEQMEEKESLEGLEEKNQAFWDRLSRNMIKAKSLLEDLAKKSGITLNDINIDSQDIRKNEKLRSDSTNHPLTMLSRKYDEVARQWLKTQPGMLDKLEELKHDLTIGVETQAQAHQHVSTIKDSLAVIQWYSSFICSKIVRALMGKDNDLFDNDDAQNDSNGSAKVALIGIERSMQAWLDIFSLLPEQEDHFLNTLSLLEQMKGQLVKEFPHAMEFVRPGFDELIV
jgi:hypothetical protein